jgi:alpha-glucosidase
VLSNHDVVRHATRYGLPAPGRTTDGRPADRHGRTWLLAGGVDALDAAGGVRRARAATLFLLGLPGSAYLYQGEELGLHEVADIPAALRQDPTHARSTGFDVGRDGCRVPLPWSGEGPSFGFGSGPAHLPQPGWMAGYAVTAQEGDPGSTLNLYRRALRLRRSLLAGEGLEWRDTGRPDVLRFARHPGWEVVTNFGTTDLPLHGGEVLLSSGVMRHDVVPAETTVWIAPPGTPQRPARARA